MATLCSDRLNMNSSCVRLKRKTGSGKGVGTAGRGPHDRHVHDPDAGRCDRGDLRVAVDRERGGRGVAEQHTTEADEPGDERTLAVVPPVEPTGPVPVVGLVRGEVVRAPPGHVRGVEKREAGHRRRPEPAHRVG